MPNRKIRSGGNPSFAKTRHMTEIGDRLYSRRFARPNRKMNRLMADQWPDHPVLLCCFLPNQKVNLADGTYKEIKDVKVGEKVQVFDTENMKVETSEVESLSALAHDDIYKVSFENGKVLKPTGNHPFWTKDKDWTTIDGHSPNLGGGTKSLVAGDFVYDSKNEDWTRVIAIEPIEGEFYTYNFTPKSHPTIIADDIVTHNTHPCDDRYK